MSKIKIIMINNDPDKLFLKIEEFKKKNYKILKEWYDLLEESKVVLFKEYCSKHYLDQCEPWSCSERITGKCAYLDKLELLDKLTKI